MPILSIQVEKFSNWSVTRPPLVVFSDKEERNLFFVFTNKPLLVSKRFMILFNFTKNLVIYFETTVLSSGVFSGFSFSVRNELTSPAKGSLSSFTFLESPFQEFLPPDISRSIWKPGDDAWWTTLLIVVSRSRDPDACVSTVYDRGGIASSSFVLVDAIRPVPHSPGFTLLLVLPSTVPQVLKNSIWQYPRFLDQRHDLHDVCDQLLAGSPTVVSIFQQWSAGASGGARLQIALFILDCLCKMKMTKNLKT